MSVDGKTFIDTAKAIYGDIRADRPPDEGVPAGTHQVIPPAVVRGTRGYIEAVANQINGTYEKGWFDACAVMMRRLLETLIIEAFEHHGVQARIKNPEGDYVYLKDLILGALSETSWELSRNAKQALPKLKELGDRSAHSRRYTAHRQDVEGLSTQFRVVVQEFVFIASLK